MNPNISAMMQSLQGAPEGAPTGGLSDGNPFAGLIKGFKPAGQEQAPVQAPQAPSQGTPAGMEENQLQQGVNTGTTKPLLSALQGLHAYIAESQDPQEIRIARNIIALLSQLIQRDQSQQEARLPKGGGQ
ncbi:hypothetical protein M0R04_15095 [Candidatus Dojkabacteria bacterium]|jgi:hypothetical protein|nr:hypothetical protein [Candidatus Dojkabacteria bacterium]